MALFWCWLRSFWTDTTMPVGEVGEPDRRVCLVDVLTAGARGPVGVDPQVLVVDGDLVGQVLEKRRHVERGEARLPAMLRIEGRHPHQTVDTALGGQQAVGEPSLHDEGGRQQPRLLACGRLVDLDLEAPALGPALVHPQEHLAPVLGVGPARTGVELGDGVVLVVLAGEEAAQLEVVEPPGQIVDDGR